jgi:hypothetical protein
MQNTTEREDESVKVAELAFIFTLRRVLRGFAAPPVDRHVGPSAIPKIPESQNPRIMCSGEVMP